MRSIQHKIEAGVPKKEENTSAIAKLESEKVKARKINLCSIRKENKITAYAKLDVVDLDPPPK